MDKHEILLEAIKNKKVTFQIQKLAKEKMGWNMLDVAGQLLIMPDAVRHWNQGITIPRFGRILELCAMFKISLAEIEPYIFVNGTPLSEFIKS